MSKKNTSKPKPVSGKQEDKAKAISADSQEQNAGGLLVAGRVAASFWAAVSVVAEMARHRQPRISRPRRLEKKMGERKMACDSGGGR